MDLVGKKKWLGVKFDEKKEGRELKKGRGGRKFRGGGKEEKKEKERKGALLFPSPLHMSLQKSLSKSPQEWERSESRYEDAPAKEMGRIAPGLDTEHKSHKSNNSHHQVQTPGLDPFTYINSRLRISVPNSAFKKQKPCDLPEL